MKNYKIGDKVKINWEKYKNHHECSYLKERFAGENLPFNLVMKVIDNCSFNSALVQLKIPTLFTWNIKPEYLISEVPKTHNHPLTKMFL